VKASLCTFSVKNYVPTSLFFYITKTSFLKQRSGSDRWYNDRSYYVGSTDNIEQRLSQHQSGAGSKYTVARLPVELVWVADFQTRDEAFAADPSTSSG
jgi:hypothetical protein